MNEDITSLTATVVAAFLQKNILSVDQIPGLIRTVHSSLSTAGGISAPPVEVRTPAVPIKKSVGDEHITCLVCGWRGTILKRHLQTSHGQTPDAYRAEWNLSPEYPMTARNYSQHRSALAKRIGLGRRSVPPLPPVRAGGRRLPAVA